MIRKAIAITIATSLLALAAAVANSGEVYKWVDSKGKVHYGDRPQNQQSSKLKIKETERSDTALSDTERRAKRDKLLQIYADERAEAKRTAEEKKQRLAQARRNCNRAKDNLEQIRNAGYLYEIDENGERIIHDTDQRQVATLQAEAAVKQWCKIAR